jgi:beta-glucanase (GH16 family)
MAQHDGELCSMTNLSNFHLTFDDEFNSFSGWDTTIFGSRTLSGNGGQEFYSDSSVGVSPFTLHNGELTITAAPGSNPLGLAYDSGIITTLGHFSQEYGYFEMRAELPQGAGMWPGFWLLPTSQAWPPEIDILEAFGAKATDGQGGSNMVHVNAISTVPGESTPAWIGIPGNIYTAYHTYGVDWEASTTTFYIDGQAVSQIKTPDDMHQKMFMLANLAVGGSWPGSATGETGQMKIDYIRAYSSDPSTHTVAQQTISSPDGANTTPSALAGSSSGPGTIVLHVSEDAALGLSNAKFTVSVDNHPVGDILTVTAIHAAGQWQDITLHGNFDNGPHTINVDFINDAIGRNMYVQSITVNGEHIAGTAAHDYADSGLGPLYDPHAAVFLSAGSAVFTAHGDAQTTTPPPPPSTGSGSDTLTLHISEDAWKGNAQFTVGVDGHQVGGVQTATASHTADQWQDIALKGDFGSGNHSVTVNYINDAWGGSSSTDRNLYVQYVDLDGVHMSGNTALNNASAGQASLDTSAAVMKVDGTATFHPDASQTSTMTLHVSEDAWLGNAQFTVKVDGHQVGGIQTATANHTAGQVQNITLTGNFGPMGPDTVDITFLNDAWGGSHSTDRNLYVHSIDVNGVNFAGNAITANTASGGFHDANAALLANNGTAEFDIHHTAPPSDYWHV